MSDRGLLTTAGGRDGCSWYRVEVPARWLREQGVTVRTKYADQGDVCEAEGDLEGIGTFFNSRGVDPTLLFAALAMQQRGIRVVYDMDDDLWALPEWNYHAALTDERMRKNMTSMVRVADVVTTPTQVLAGRLEALGGKPRVIPNALPSEAFVDRPRAPHTGLRIGWAGSATHIEDLAQVHAAFAQLLLDRLDVTLVFFGWTPPLWIHYVRAESHPWVQLPAYYDALAALDLDIFVAPLAACAFNEAKSPLKLYEAGAMGWPIVCTDFGPYAGAPDGVPALRVPLDRPDRWHEALTVLCRDPALRRALGGDAQRHVAARHRIDHVGPQWLEALDLSPVEVA